jgi:hypothetical protein
MKQISLTRSKVALVDDADFDWLNQWKWYANQSRNTFYAVRWTKSGRIKMHRLILSAPPGIETDHINHDGLDNRRANLRLATSRQNSHNRKVRKDSRTGIKGVTWKAREAKWWARISVNGKRIQLGSYREINDAAAAYRSAAKQYFGDYANV